MDRERLLVVISELVVNVTLSYSERSFLKNELMMRMSPSYQDATCKFSYFRIKIVTGNSLPFLGNFLFFDNKLLSTSSKRTKQALKISDESDKFEGLPQKKTIG